MSGAVELQQVSVAVDGKQAGGLAGEALSRNRGESLPLASVQLVQGDHELTVHARAVHRDTADVLVVNTTQGFTVGREPVSLVARFSVPPNAGRSSRLAVDVSAEGGTLRGGGGPYAKGSCDALTPAQTAMCQTEALLREAIAEHDAPRVVCIDDTLARMRQIVGFERPDHGGGTEPATRHEAAVAKDLSFELARLAEQARRCRTEKAAEIGAAVSVESGAGR